VVAVAIRYWVTLGRVWWWVQKWAHPPASSESPELSVSAPVDYGDAFSHAGLNYFFWISLRAVNSQKLAISERDEARSVDPAFGFVGSLFEFLPVHLGKTGRI
jgi:hypothetical protein